MEVNDQFHAPATLTLWKEPQYSKGRRLGGLQSWSGLCGEEKNLLLLLEM
jgi:hypothetical protein